MDKLNFLIWNVRGLNDKARRDNLRKVVDDTRPAVVCLQETKLSYISERDVISFLGRDFTKFVFLSAQQTRGGILIAWRDANTSFFHKQAGFRKRKNFISKLVEGDRVAITQEDKHQVLFNHFDGVLGQAKARSVTFDLAAFHRAGIDLSILDEPFTEEEIWATIQSLPADRAPGPDGFTGQFYKTCWPIIKTDFITAIVFLQQGDARKLELLNSAYLTLIPKKVEALEAKDFRPISLIHSFAKLVTKLMANRLAPLLDRLVATNQSAFTRGRCIHDNFMLVQQTIKVLHRRKIASLFLKLDISKAFDSVAWAFLLEILEHLGFGDNWRNLISNLLKSASTQVLLNGEPGEIISHQRGLRQGDLLSPMLFILVMDVLNSLFIQAESEGRICPSMQMMWHSLFALKKLNYTSQKTSCKFLVMSQDYRPIYKRAV